MSNALALATVTETLYQVLTAALPGSLVSGAQVTALRPDDDKLPMPGVNIFLYQVTPNTAWRNADLPTRNSDGSLRRRPQVALDLHYLLTFYGSDAGFEQQRLLGAVARALHAAPTLDPALIQATENQTDSASGKRIFDSDLSNQVDLVRVTPINFSLEEMSKLWSVFLKTDYVLSLAYVAGVVLIETDDPAPAAALPVLRPAIRATPFTLAVIDTVEPASVGLSGGTANITLSGQGLSAVATPTFRTPGKPDAFVGTVAPGSSGTQLGVTLPPGLRPGVNTVELTQFVPDVSPPLVQSQSNVATFTLLPTMVSLGSGSTPGTLAAVISPPAGPAQQVSLVLNTSTGPSSLLLNANPHAAETATFTFQTSVAGTPLPTGTYLARLRVDTAESRLTVGASGAFNGPLVTLP